MITNPDALTLALLGEIRALSPDVRWGQLFAHLGFLGEDQFDVNLWNIEDEQFQEILHRHLIELRAADSGSIRTASPVVLATNTNGVF